MGAAPPWHLDVLSSWSLYLPKVTLTGALRVCLRAEDVPLLGLGRR